MVTELQPINAQRVYQQVAEQLLDLIRSGSLQTGDLLPPERELATHLRVSRVSIRDAIRFLEARGILEVRQGGGTRVRKPDAAILIHPLDTLLDTHSDLLRHLFDLRTMVEPEFAAQAALRRSRQQLTQLERVIARQRRRSLLGELPVEEDDAFHQHIVEATQNPVALEMYALISGYLAAGRNAALQSRERAEWSLQGHQAILAAINRQDAGAAASEMRRHIQQVEVLLFGLKGDSLLNAHSGGR